ncbi:hypothetical protein KQQSB11_220037 [Klebsiella quasipneumoniae subsp. quasipneumoniae]|nr:hypothetical protein KQQSB11_220037 [Klebsiella quasipneumoniae subsp. quasipneumoniae]
MKRVWSSPYVYPAKKSKHYQCKIRHLFFKKELTNRHKIAVFHLKKKWC